MNYVEKAQSFSKIKKVFIRDSLAVTRRLLGYDSIVGLVHEHGRVVVQVHHAHLHHHMRNPEHNKSRFNACFINMMAE
jgi:hypothetical protein